MSATAAIAAARAGVKVYKAANKAGRHAIATEEIEREKDIDGNLCIGCVGRCRGKKCPNFQRRGQHRPAARRAARQ